MAARMRPQHQEDVRAKIQTSQLINRLQDHVLNDLPLSKSQVSAIQILLRKTIPDLSATELSGTVGFNHEEALDDLR